MVRTLADACIALAAGDYALMLLDINLPDGSGLDFLLGLRQSSRMPVILITANDMETDIVVGLESGADDYITKPFSLAVLRARVHTQLRKIAVRETRMTLRLGRESALHCRAKGLRSLWCGRLPMRALRLPGETMR